MDRLHLQNPETRQPNPDLQRACTLLNASTPLELSQKYDAIDQELMRTRSWDYENPELLTNQVKEILEKIDARYLDEDEGFWKNEILWFWYHHAISCAIWRYRDKKAALEFADKALAYQSADHPNQITKLLQLLVQDKVAEAKTWTATISEEPEKTTASNLISEYEHEKWF